jgi:hypothetical protein
VLGEFEGNQDANQPTAGEAKRSIVWLESYPDALLQNALDELIGPEFRLDDHQPEISFAQRD